MDEKLEFTKQQLIDAFMKWDEDYKNNPREFADMNNLNPLAQAETLIEYLKAV